MLKELRTDWGRYRGAEASAVHTLLNTALWGVACHRFGHWVYKERRPDLLQPLLKTGYQVINKLLEATTEMFLDAQAEIGAGLYIAHSGGVHINEEAVVGAGCDLGHQVTIGTSAMGRSGAPVLGDGVYVGAGAKILGAITVGDGAKIAANSLVIADVPAHATVMGVPARIVLRGAPREQAAESTARESA